MTTKVQTPVKEKKRRTEPFASLMLKYEIIVHDRDGNVIQRSRRKSRSFVVAFMAGILGSLISINTDLTGTHLDITGVARTLSDGLLTSSSTIQPFKAPGAVGVTTSGIVIGTDTTPVVATDTKLIAQILDGAAPGQMEHLAQINDSAVTTTATTCLISFYRNFQNDTAGNITIGEIGMYGQLYDSGSALRDFCFIRDVPTPFVVPAGGGVTIRYSIITTT